MNKAIEREERYLDLYNKVEEELKSNGYIKESLMELCSAEIDRNGNENQVNIQLLLESNLEQKTELVKCFDKHSKRYGFNINYTNLTGKLY